MYFFNFDSTVKRLKYHWKEKKNLISKEIFIFSQWFFLYYNLSLEAF